MENDYYFVDTSEMIAEIYREAADIALITRPRRFGKTLNMSMLRYFFDNRLETSELFKGLRISEDEEMMKKINGYPVIFITFKDFKDNCWENTEIKLKNLLSGLYDSFYETVFPFLKSDIEKEIYSNIINRKANIVDYQEALKKLTEFLFRVFNKPVILLIDEYDVPIQSGWTYGYYDEVIPFMRGLLSGALKDNSFLFKGVLTGIYRVAKESIFSGLNNLLVYTVLDERYSHYFGFTEQEVLTLLTELNLKSNQTVSSDLKTWYNGYKFGITTIYNPWSVLCYLEQEALRPYWINTSSNDLIINILENNLKTDNHFREEIEQLIDGKKIEKVIDDSSALRDLADDPDSIWSLFLFSGYLKAENRHEDEKTEEIKYDCSIPNQEVTRFYKKTIVKWFQKANRNILQDITKPLLNGQGELFCKKLKTFILESLSFYDLRGEPENTYHMILLGMFAHLGGAYWIKSNRESGDGRYDIQLKAKDKSDYSAVIEIKSSVRKTEDGMRQISEKAYTTELLSEGYTRILKIALGVDGKTIEAFVEGD